MPPTETEITTACTSNNHDMLNPTATAPPYSDATPSPSPHEQEIKVRALLVPVTIMIMLNPSATAPPYSVATPSPHEQEIKSKSLLLGFVSPCSRASSHLVDVFFPPQGN